MIPSRHPGCYIPPANADHPREPQRQPEETIPKKKTKGKGAENNGGAPATSSRAKPDAKVRGHEAHVLVCKGGDCKKRGAKDVRAAFKSGLRAAGMNGDVRVDSVECLGLCKHGPNSVVYPSGTWYLSLNKADVLEIVERHLIGGEPVDNLAAEFRSPKKRGKAKR
ncbi:MAG: (2Fe-2S) ferredoxin domain-containing protein [Actinomycetota bacterium]|nr:(2Fe-2S) ferredoxin domain-containing protein [Actinomycetota bacterium]